MSGGEPADKTKGDEDAPQGRELAVVSQSDLDMARLESRMMTMMFEQRIASIEREHASRLEASKSVAALEAKLARMEGREEARQEVKVSAPLSAVPQWTGNLVQSTILQPAHQQMLLAQQPGNWTLIYRASTHGQTSANFHACCDNRGPTIVVVRSGANVFGGFASLSWNSSSGYINAPGSFLFTAVNPYGDGFRILPCSSPGNAMYCNSGYGPTFGGGHDLHLPNNCLSCNGSCNPGSSYTVTSSGSTNTFVGSTKFLASEVEVFARV